MGLTSFPLLQERGLRADDPIQVGSWPLREVYVSTQRCPCGGRLDIRDSQLRRSDPGGAPCPLPGEVLERCRLACARCSRRRALWFDLSRFFDDPLANRRFGQVRKMFAEGLSMVEAGRVKDARTRFVEICAREPWFGLAWFHHGMMHLLHEQPEQALEPLTQAAGIMPMNATVHDALADTLELLDMPLRASRHRSLARELDELLDEEEDQG